MPLHSSSAARGPESFEPAELRPAGNSIGPGEGGEDEAVGKLIGAILAEAALPQVSEIHIEPCEAVLLVRARANGTLRETWRMPPEMAPPLARSIKEMAGLDPAERRLPQRGRVRFDPGRGPIDARIFTLPSRWGERIALHMVAAPAGEAVLELPGMPVSARATYLDALAARSGVVLVAGPSGSGKTTTLHAGIARLNDGSRNILTLEERLGAGPEGVGQVEVPLEAGLTAAAALRAVLEHGPDVVMVGDIADREAADIAFRAASEGRLMLLGVAAEDAVGAIAHMHGLKIDPFLLASTLRAVVAQRLAPRLCQECRAVVQASKSLSALLGFDPGAIVYEARGCGACDHSGYQGLVGVFEAIRVDDALKRLINNGGDEAVISNQAFRGSPNLASSARALASEGLIAAEEAIRLSRRTVTQRQ